MYKNYAMLRDKKGVTDYAVAVATGIPKSTFSEWKKGSYNPKVEKLIKIADFFEVSLDVLLKDTGEESKYE